ncbi:Hypothetical protein BQ3484_289 [Cedratvirus A11]|uniref:Uncharacterized protein n=1 Tax=Cedratvirus A11 TaxID=1903266 RepID=A0A1M7XUN0_9VIRU|nr:Hypothetical protein BQ3484_289 [Cedratvirus A11]SHO33357.1 Hypothetical protein BQ3484_289 [Cedratvirus A11]
MSAYFGEQECSAVYKSGTKKGLRCRNKAYYEVDEGGLFCGVHSAKMERTELPKNPNAAKNEEEQRKEHKRGVEMCAEQNRKQHKTGSVAVSKMRMMKKVEPKPGYLSVFPNYKHGNRQDGLGLPSLSPKSLGPVRHNVPDLASAENLENFWQFSKAFAFEVDTEGNLLPIFEEKRKQGFTDATPHRHKYEKKVLSKYSTNVNKPLFSVFVDKHGKERRFSYIQARYFYCKIYEELAKKQKDFAKLQELISEGYNLNLVGYDGYEVSDDLMWHYLDEAQPFGHELVLYTLLTREEDDYPWNVYREENKKLYAGF